MVPDETLLPPGLQKQIELQKARGQIVAALHGGCIYVVANRVKGFRHLQAVFRHEMSHWGGRKLFGKHRRIAYRKLLRAMGGCSGLNQYCKEFGLEQDMAPYFQTLARTDQIQFQDQGHYIADEFLAVLNSKPDLYSDAIYEGPNVLMRLYSCLPESAKMAVCKLTGWARDQARKRDWWNFEEVSSSDLAYILRQINRAAQGRPDVSIPYLMKVEADDEVTLFFSELAELFEA